MAVAVVAIAASVEFGSLPAGGGLTRSATSVCSSCFQQEPVVDIVMPALGSSGNISNPNRVVNMTLQETKTFQVDIYPTVGLGFDMAFRSLLVSPAPGTSPGGQEANLIAVFQPSSLSVGANAKGVTELTVSVPGNATRGTYDVVVSATNQGNSSQVWGLYFEVSVG